jgi:TorA maturation chaperone TorD
MTKQEKRQALAAIYYRTKDAETVRQIAHALDGDSVELWLRADNVDEIESNLDALAQAGKLASNWREL